ncbi:HTH-type transcriptional activator RhaS [Methyloligella halotolerans]|uniref:HTH-type transcriptional activator RhaS n=1 Tax=Methyloligella halotolerans TaxID=1177755 RepID=A0A1E2RVH6_9HYPH|nr:AraC family transcriptional regulator [Methyloligella halotolerans]ODA66135.1 HTH-type transcriptional activator RhaS [Methyloligella halotolerans]
MTPTSHFAPVPHRLSSGSPLGSTPVICVVALAGVPAFVRNTFGDGVLQRANEAALLDIEAIEDQDCFIPQLTMTTFAEAVAKQAGEEFFGLKVAPALSIANYGCWGQYILGAVTLGEALQRAVATVGFHSKGDVFSVVVADELVRVSYGSAAKGQPGYRHVACGSAGVVLSICKLFLPEHWRPLRIELDIPKPKRPQDFEDIFQCPVAFDAQAVSICLESHRLASGPARCTPRALITPEDLARSRVECLTLTGLQDIIVQQIWSQVLSGHVSIESAARSINTSVRTLQRELHREGTDFRSISNAMRTKRACELLRQTDASITEIATALGYSDSAHFARAFRHATGMAPQEYRLLGATANNGHARSDVEDQPSHP